MSLGHPGQEGGKILRFQSPKVTKIEAEQAHAEIEDKIDELLPVLDIWREELEKYLETVPPHPRNAGITIRFVEAQKLATELNLVIGEINLLMGELDTEKMLLSKGRLLDKAELARLKNRFGVVIEPGMKKVEAGLQKWRGM